MRSKLCLGLLSGFVVLLIVLRQQRSASTASQSSNELLEAKNNAETVEHGTKSPGNGRNSPQSLQQILMALTMEEDAAVRSEKLERFSSTFSEAEWTATLNELLGAQPGEPGVELRRLLSRRWADLDPVAAAAWASALPAGSLLREAVTDVAIVWAGRDLAAAAQWARELPDADAKHSALLNISYQAARTVPLEALRIAAELPANRNRDELLTHAVSQ